MAEIVKLSKGNKKKAITAALKVLCNGGIVVIPTETSYGIAADALNPTAIEKVHAAKQQPKDKPISIIVANEKQAEKIAEISKEGKKLMKKFMPGPLTLVCRKKKIVPEILSKESIAFRISSNSFARKLVEKFPGGITATSANIHGQAAIYSAKEAIETFRNKVDLIIDSGELPAKEASTIYDLINKRIIRRGAISEERILEALK